MSEHTHKALDALRDVCETPVRNHLGERLTCRDMIREDHIACPPCAALEALLAERDELLAIAKQAAHDLGCIASGEASPRSAAKMSSDLYAAIAKARGES